MAPKMTKEEKEWRARDDAHTLAMADEITNDKSRLALAKKEANKIAKATAERAQKFQKVAKTKVAKKRAAKKRAPRKK